MQQGRFCGDQPGAVLRRNALELGLQAARHLDGAGADASNPAQTLTIAAQRTARVELVAGGLTCTQMCAGDMGAQRLSKGCRSYKRLRLESRAGHGPVFEGVLEPALISVVFTDRTVWRIASVNRQQPYGPPILLRPPNMIASVYPVNLRGTMESAHRGAAEAFASVSDRAQNTLWI